jgi:hypothetical protein
MLDTLVVSLMMNIDEWTWKCIERRISSDRRSLRHERIKTSWCVVLAMHDVLIDHKYPQPVPAARREYTPFYRYSLLLHLVL